jgi:hypothetical protein
MIPIIMFNVVFIKWFISRLEPLALSFGSP